jgi:periplasmic protein TonB
MIMTRYLVSILVAVGVTLGLFYLMYSLVRVTEPTIDENAKSRAIDFVRLKRDEATKVRDRELPDKPPPPDQPPPPPDMSKSKPDYAGAGGMKVSMSFGNTGIKSGITLGAPPSDRDAMSLLIATSELVYPNRARSAGKEGYADVEFTVSRTGAVVDPAVIGEDPEGWGFGDAAVKTVLKWRYQAKVENGQPVERPGIRVRIRFNLQNK